MRDADDAGRVTRAQRGMRAVFDAFSVDAYAFERHCYTLLLLVSFMPLHAHEHHTIQYTAYHYYAMPPVA